MNIQLELQSLIKCLSQSSHVMIQEWCMFGMQRMGNYCQNSKLLLAIKLQRLLLTVLEEDLSQEVLKGRSEFGTSQMVNDLELASTTMRIQIQIMTTVKIIMRNYISSKSTTKKTKKKMSKKSWLLIKMRTKTLLLQEKLK